MSDGGWRYSRPGVDEDVKFPVRSGHCGPGSRGVFLFRGFDAFVSIISTQDIEIEAVVRCPTRKSDKVLLSRRKTMMNQMNGSSVLLVDEA
jgi:hypothetical protein